jgi:type III secretion protein HrpB1
MNQPDVCIPFAPAPAVVGSIIDLAAAALSGDKSPVEMADVEQVIDALRVWRPACVEFAYLDGLVQIHLGNWTDAEFIFGGLVLKSRCMPASQAMQLRCMHALGSPGWQHEARRLAEDSSSGDAGAVARSMLADDELQQAIRTAHRTGVFVAPESATAAQEAAQPRTAATSGLSHVSLAADLSLMMNYMRI